ncbi:hypothetical protein [Microvirga rosea]|uniref:hypothetical protein n=1 Tax=Microvirga rosea TaxID=2715425 RepID=UPI001D0A3335|nr:hypothetical protein [Microvirga rosea]
MWHRSLISSVTWFKNTAPLPYPAAQRIHEARRGFQAHLQRGWCERLRPLRLEANKSGTFLEAASQCGIGVDVASREEMTAALAAGVKGENLTLTGPDKGPFLHRLALRQNLNDPHSAGVELLP